MNRAGKSQEPPERDGVDGTSAYIEGDIFTGILKQQARARAQALLSSQRPRQTPIGDFIGRVRLFVISAPVLALFLLVGLLALVGGAVIALSAESLWTDSAPTAATDVVVALGAATAFGSVVFTFVGVSFGNAASISAGFSATQLTSYVPGLPGLVGICMSGLFFIVATLGPTEEAARAATLCAIGVVILGWAGALEALRQSDPLSVAQHAASHYQRLARRSRTFMSSAVRRRYRRFARANPDILRIATVVEDLAIPGGLIRQLGAGIRATSTPQRLSEASELFRGVIGIVRDTSQHTNGNIGPVSAVTEPLYSVARDLVAGANKAGRHEIADAVVSAVAALARETYTSTDYDSLRQWFPQFADRIIEETWSDDNTTTTTRSITELGKCYGAWLEFGAYALADSTLKNIGKLGTRALVEGRHHVVGAVSSALGSALPPAVAFERTPHQDRWIEVASSFATAALLIDDATMLAQSDLFIPGEAIFSTLPSLQRSARLVAPQHIARTGRYLIEVARRSLANTNNAVQRSTAELAAGPDASATPQPLRRASERAFELAYFGAHMVAVASVCDLASAEASSESSRETALATSALNSMLAGFSFGESTRESERALEMAWSAMVAMLFARRDDLSDQRGPEVFSGALRSAKLTQESLRHDNYLCAVVLGLEVLNGASEETVANLEAEYRDMRSKDVFSEPLGTWHLPIEGYGRAPRPARNAFDPLLPILDAVDAWACEAWPSLAGAPKE